MELGQRLRELRENKDLMQKTVAKKIGISNKVLSNYENDIRLPDLQTFKQLCTFYNISADLLLEIEIPSKRTATELSDEDKRLLYYYHRLNEDYRDSARGNLVDLYREQQNLIMEKNKRTESK